ncbi:MAG: cyclic beta 1-2 glucan synthetase, partial [Burkholderiaceae bacterium]|nr:cyclic beta 1-2 glucan synthetase [Burkholderiaceae bacterium]
VRRSALESLYEFGRKHPLGIYLGSIAAITTTLTTGLVARAYPSLGDAGSSVWFAALTLIVIVSLLATSQLAVAIVNWVATLWLIPRPLPRMDYGDGVAPGARTLVAVPTMLTDAAGVESLIEALEVRFLANRDPLVHFALLTDFPDATAESLPTDAPLLQLAQRRIEELNQRYQNSRYVSTADSFTDDPAPDDRPLGDPFYLLHRPRRWNAQQRIWMGYERKRGKLGDLNALLRGHSSPAFSLIVGATEVLTDVKYVITLDTDTQLPRDSARQLVGVMAHPLNSPQFDRPTSDQSGRRVVTTGYGILQPRVAVTLPSTRRSIYARLYGGEPGLDPYTRTVSDVYQDAFDEGSFIGKGIYDVDAFEGALADRFPDNSILSHDLLEGCYARSGLLSDVQLYENFPTRYSADVARRHRWIRGDWQLVGWLRRRVPTRDGRVRNPLSALSQWKVFDNVRRSLVPTALLLLLLLGWGALPDPLFWTIVVLAVLLVPALATALTDLLRKPTDAPFEQHLRAVAATAQTQFTQVLLTLAWLPYEVSYSLDAIVRTVWRTLVSHRRLLEWNPSSEVERALEENDGTDLASTYRTMWTAPAIAVLAWTVIPAMNVSALRVAAPILLLWLVSPAVAWWVSRPLPPRREELSSDQTRFLRALARKTWGYFETYVSPEENWLPPDNVQQKGEVVIAHRTSPTNMGLALLADLTAHDFGYLSAGQLVARLTNVMRTMGSLERHRGHFLNWYDTRTLAPLNPRYISTVDSGNLAGHLMTLRAGLVALIDAPILQPRWLDGIRDTFDVLAQSAEKDGRPLPGGIAEFSAAIDSAAAETSFDLASAWTRIDALTRHASDIAQLFAAHVTVQAPSATSPLLATRNVEDHGLEAVGWSQALLRQCTGLREDLLFLAPWLASAGAAAPSGAGVPSLRELASLDPATDAASLAAQGAVRARERIAAIEQLMHQAGEMAAV